MSMAVPGLDEEQQAFIDELAAAAEEAEEAANARSAALAEELAKAKAARRKVHVPHQQ